jgi:phosphatidylinositol kinase/protein kinase (PI-3  family)
MQQPFQASHGLLCNLSLLSRVVPCYAPCFCSDGKEYGFLAKPKDDLRKDYRLMDFVCVLNDLLGRELASRRRGLALRTYAVIPLAEECGILQWVNGLVAFKGACEEVYGAERLYKRNVTPVQIKKMYDSFGGGCWPVLACVLSCHVLLTYQRRHTKCGLPDCMSRKVVFIMMAAPTCILNRANLP